MSKVYILMADGLEEIEGLTVVDLLRRARIDIKMVSITDTLKVVTSHKIEIRADILLKDIIDEKEEDFADMIVLPGGMTGTNNLKASADVDAFIRKYNAAGKYLAAVCAAPTVYGEKGLLEGRKATCYPGLEDGLLGAVKMKDNVVVDGQFITSRGFGTSIDFGLKMIELLISPEKAGEIGTQIVYYDQNR
ncbi:4-methyl-5(b-hydroxyethyl)-thiazole monophosphate biosynthesis [Eubacterium ruminantium]|nr:4-methyl-5(b-hydroxyethyl)-thiazole monophosphate biosynthesis [Eubacterium ruminantium]